MRDQVCILFATPASSAEISLTWHLPWSFLKAKMSEHRAVVLSRGDLVPGGHWAMSGDILGCPDGKGATGM